MREKVVGVRVNKAEGAILAEKAEGYGYGLSTAELLRVSGLLFSELLRDYNISDDTVGRVFKALAVDDITTNEVLAALREPGGDYELLLDNLVRTGTHQVLQTAS